MAKRARTKEDGIKCWMFFLREFSEISKSIKYCIVEDLAYCQVVLLSIRKLARMRKKKEDDEKRNHGKGLKMWKI